MWKNDIGDNIAWIKKVSNRPYARKISSEPGFSIEKSFNDQFSSNKKFTKVLFKYIKSKSMLARVVSQRITLLKTRGIQITVDEKEMGMSTKAQKDIPNQNDLPSSWPQNIKEYAEGVAFSILKVWSTEIQRAGKKFAILYIPRGPDYLSEMSQRKDTFKGWLVNSCERLNIPLIDPSKGLLKKQREGVEVYRDHFMPEGHAVVGDVISQWLHAELELLVK